VNWYDIYTGEDQDTTIYIPLKIEIITDPDNPIEIGQESWLGDYDIFSDPSWHETHYSPLGWDLEPGGAGYNPNYPWQYIWPDVLLLERKILDQQTGFEKYAGLKLFTQNFPTEYLSQGGFPKFRTAVKPADGDQFTIRTKKLFRSEIFYEFQTNPPSVSTDEKNLSLVKVVPNPFIVRAGWESSQFEGRLQFANLPNECEIVIYSTAGDHIITLRHNSLSDSEFWNLQNDSGVNVAYGLYVYVVKTPDGDKHTGKFVVIR